MLSDDRDASDMTERTEIEVEESLKKFRTSICKKTYSGVGEANEVHET